MNIFVEMGRLLRAIPIEDGLKNVCLRDSREGHNERSLIEASIEGQFDFGCRQHIAEWVWVSN